MTTAGDQIMVIYTGMCTSLTCNVSCQRCYRQMGCLQKSDNMIPHDPRKHPCIPYHIHQTPSPKPKKPVLSQELELVRFGKP